MTKSTEEKLSNRIFRSATFEGMADENGKPVAAYLKLYDELSWQGVKNIISGCSYTSQDGMMVQPGQAGIHSDILVDSYRAVTDRVHEHSARIYMQLSHAGRQTSSRVTGQKVVGVTGRKSPYFGSEPVMLSAPEIGRIVEGYASAAFRAKQAGFDGVQIHAAHGYLVHQFIHPYLNTRRDEYGVNPRTGIGELFLSKIIEGTRALCGENYPVLVKISASDELKHPFSTENFINLIKMLDKEKLFAIEISYGTMEHALNIFRGASIPVDTILQHNYRYKTKNKAIRKLWKLIAFPLAARQMKGFSENYNLAFADLAKRYTATPIICVGGFRKGTEIIHALTTGKTDYISLCRPLICEPDFVSKLKVDGGYISMCENCNICAIMCDSGNPTRCYKSNTLDV